MDVEGGGGALCGVISRRTCNLPPLSRDGVVKVEDRSMGI